jgi:hypothetical protein
MLRTRLHHGNAPMSHQVHHAHMSHQLHHAFVSIILHVSYTYGVGREKGGCEGIEFGLVWATVEAQQARHTCLQPTCSLEAQQSRLLVAFSCSQRDAG